MKKRNNLNTFIIFIIVIFIILLPVLLSYTMKDITSWGVLVTYLGSIIGGFLTLSGVYYTIKHTSREKTKELELLYKPVVRATRTEEKVLSNKEINIVSNNDKYKDNDPLYPKPLLEIKNVGRGEMQNVRLHNVKVSCVTTIMPDIKGYFLNEEIIDMLAINDSIYITIGTPISKDKKEKENIYTVSFDMEYNGILNNTIFRNHISFCVSNNNKNKGDIYNIKVRNN